MHTRGISWKCYGKKDIERRKGAALGRAFNNAAPEEKGGKEEKMQITIENDSSTGVIITEVHVTVSIPVSIQPGGSPQIDVPFDHCEVAVTYNDHGITENKKRIAPVTNSSNHVVLSKVSGGSEITIH
jgi:hypothetical protein